MRPDLNATKDEMMAWIDYLETKVERLHTHIEYLTEIDPKRRFEEKPSEDGPCYCDDCLGIF